MSEEHELETIRATAAREGAERLARLRARFVDIAGALDVRPSRPRRSYEL